MAYTGVDEFRDLKPEKSEEEVVKLYNDRVHKVILAWKNLHGLFENIQNDNSIRPLIDQGKPGSASGGSELPELEMEREKRETEEVKKTNQVRKETSQSTDTAQMNSKVQASAVKRAGEEMKPSPVKVEKRRDDERSIERDIGSFVDERKKPLHKIKELSEVEPGLDRDKNEGDELKKTAQVIKEISERKVKERAAAKVKLIGALASELGDEVKMLKDQLHQVKLEKKQLEEKNIQKDKYIRSLVDERKQLLSRVSKLSEELNALSVAHQFRSTAEAHHRSAGSQASASRLANKQTTPTKQAQSSQHM